MSDRPDLDEAIKILQAGGIKITGGRYAPVDPVTGIKPALGNPTPKVEPPKDDKKTTMTIGHIEVATRQLQEAEITIGEFLELVNAYIKLQQEALLDRVDKSLEYPNFRELPQGLDPICAKLAFNQARTTIDKLRLEL
jgi:hypothetical protein